METQPAFIRTDRAVHFDAEAAVDLNISLIVRPGHAEHQHAFRLDDAVQNAVRLILGMLRQYQPKRIEYLAYCLMELRLGGGLRLHTRSEERRGGEEGRSRWSPYPYKNN